MADQEKDIKRYEATDVNVVADIIQRQSGYANDTYKLIHKYTGGTVKKWTADDQKKEYTEEVEITKTTRQLRLAYDATNYVDFTVDGNGNLTVEPTRASVQTSDAFIIDGTGNVGLGIVAPDGLLHVHTGTAGTVQANSLADDLIVENNGNAGISILSPDGSPSYLMWGSPSDDDYAYFQATQSSNELELWINDTQIANWSPSLVSMNGGAQDIDIRFSGDNVLNLLYVNAGDDEIGIGTSDPGARFDILSTTTQLRLSYDATNYCDLSINALGDLTIEPSGNDIRVDAKLTIDANEIAGGGISLLGYLADTWISFGNDGGVGDWIPSLTSKSDQTDEATFKLRSIVDLGADSGSEPAIELYTEYGNVSFAKVTTRPILNVTNYDTLYVQIIADGGVKLTSLKSGATQGGAGAAANELWVTSSHATLPDNVVMIGV